jgi:hypothetical protein
MKILISTFILFLLIVNTSSGDKWPLPEEQIAESPNGKYRLVLVPEDDIKKTPPTITLEKIDQQKNEIIYKRAPVNESSPVDIYVSDFRYAVTLNNWLMSGYEHSLVIYDPKGNIIRDSRLEDIFTEQEIENKVEQTVSSRHWRYRAEEPYFNDNTIIITTLWGTSLNINLIDGKISHKKDLFPAFTEFVTGDRKADKIKIEFEDKAGGVHHRCYLVDGISHCDLIKGVRFEGWDASFLSEKQINLKTLTKALSLSSNFKKYLEGPTYCAVGCEGQKELRFFFEAEGKEFSYAIVISPRDKIDSKTYDIFSQVCQLLGFSEIPRTEEEKNSLTIQ